MCHLEPPIAAPERATCTDGEDRQRQGRLMTSSALPRDVDEQLLGTGLASRRRKRDL